MAPLNGVAKIQNAKKHFNSPAAKQPWPKKKVRVWGEGWRGGEGKIGAEVVKWRKNKGKKRGGRLWRKKLKLT